MDVLYTYMDVLDTSMDVLDTSLLLYILIDGASEVDRIAEC